MVVSGYGELYYYDCFIGSRVCRYCRAEVIKRRYDIDGPISKLLMNEPIQLVDILVPMGFALIIAVFWHIIGARLAKMFANGINKIAGKNSIMMDADMLETMLNDNQAHFLEVSFPNGTEKNGYVTNVIVSTREIMLEPEPEWTKDYNRHTKRTCINLNSGIVITEYEYK